MTCYKPVPTWRSKHPNHTGKFSRVFTEPAGEDGTRMDLPCGNCIGCRLDRAAEWQTRLIHESKEHEYMAFITCTYSPANLPPGETLVKKHFQDFIMRLRNYIRRNHDGLKIRYFACGEYGDKDKRPHYHALIFGYDFTDKKPYSKNTMGDTLYTSKILDELWGLGHCWTGSVTPKSCGYVSRYVVKKVNGQLAEKHYEGVIKDTGEVIQRLPEYIHMSTKPGIGLSFYEKHKSQIRNQDSIVVNGTERKVPRYYDKHTSKEDPQHLEWLKHVRETRAARNRADSTPERLAVREEVKKAKTQFLKRNL